MNQITAAKSPISPPGRLLREWRAARGMSQLDLAGAAETTTRHLSFVETGRAKPTPKLLHRLAQALDMPLRDRNGLLRASGFAPLYGETPLDDQTLADVRRALDFILRAHEPYPAMVLNKIWDLVLANTAAQGLMKMLSDGAPSNSEPNLFRAFMRPGPLRESVVGWEDAARVMLRRMRNEQIHRPDDARQALLDEVAKFPGVPSDWNVPEQKDPPPVQSVTFERGGIRTSWFTTVTTLGTPQDVTLQELTIESFFPANAETEAAIRRMADSN